MNSSRTTAVVAGVFFIVAAITAIVALPLYGPVLNNANYISETSGAHDASIELGALFEIFLVASVIGTAVTLFPIVRRQNESLAIGYVAGRTVEGMVITLGILSLLTAVTLRQGLAGTTGAAGLSIVGKALVTLHNWTFLLGPDTALGFNTTMLAYLMYRSRLVPRVIPTIGLIGGPVIFLSSIAVIFGLYTQVSVWGAVTALPVFAWEMSLAVWLIVKGFKPSPILGAARPTVSAAAGR